MSHTISISVRPVSFGEAVTNLVAITKSFFPANSEVTITAKPLNLDFIAQHITIPVKNAADNLEVDNFVKRINGLGVDFQVIVIVQKGPGNLQHPKRVEYRGEDVFKARLVFDNIADGNEGLSVLGSVRGAFDVTTDLKVADERLPIPYRNALEFQKESLAGLSNEVAKLAAANVAHIENQRKFISEATAQLFAEVDARKSRLETEYAARTSALEEQRTKLLSEHDSRLAELRKKEEELIERERQMDLRENTAVRRDLLKDMEKRITAQADFSLSTKTDEKRRRVELAYFGTIALALIAVVAFGFKLFSTSDLRFIVSTSGSLLFLVSTIVWYIRWSDQWFREHAHAEMMSRRLSTDILRASWLVEMLFENKDKAIDIPPALIAELSRGLFSNDPAAVTQHPADQLAELVQKVASVKVGPGQVEITKSTKD